MGVIRTVTHLERREEKVFSSCKKEVFEFSHSREHAFTSGVIYCPKAEIFSDTPHTNEQFYVDLNT